MLERLITAMCNTQRDWLRRKGTPYEALGLDSTTWTDAQLIDFMMQEPILINRPIVVTPSARGCGGPQKPCSTSCRSRSRAPSPRNTAKPLLMRRGHALQSPDLPNIDADSFRQPDMARLLPAERATHPPRILLLCSSVRERFCSLLLIYAA